MAELTTPITIVPLARDRLRLFAAPAIFVALAVAAGAGGLLAGGPARISLLGLAGLAALAGIYLASLIFSYRLMVEPGGVKLRWLGGERRYRLVHGSVTRVMVSGRGAAALHPRFGALGWAVGPAVLRGEEPIELIRLSTRPGLILVPTDRGRLAIAAKVESDLLEALRHAVRLQERLDEVTARRHMPAAAAPAEPPPPPVAPRVLTGIERSLIEQRLAAQRAAMAAAQAAEAASASAMGSEPATTMVAALPAEAVPVAAAQPRGIRRRERARWVRPSWLTVPGPATVAAAMPIGFPLVAAAIAWIAVTVTARPVVPADEGRLLLLGLALVGPIGALGGFIARTWYPRLGGLVSVSAIAALAMLTRTILA
jgi:hypothetical protein